MCEILWTTDLLPVCFSGILIFTVITSFVVALAQHDIAPWFPAVSDTAAESPESNIFSQLANILTFIGFVLIYVRYLQVNRDARGLTGCCSILVLNDYSFLSGLLTIFGASIAANFPGTQVWVVHTIATCVFFVLGNVYAWIQVFVSCCMRRFGLVSTCMCVVRIVVSVVSSLSAVTSLILLNLTRRSTGNELDWHSNDPNYTVHVIGNAFQWFVLLNFVIFILTFRKELHYNKLEIELVCNEPNPVSTC